MDRAGYDARTTTASSTGFGVTIWGTTDPLAFDLGCIAMPGCQLRADLDFIGPWIPDGATKSYSFAIPATPATLISFALFTQTATFGSPAGGTPVRCQDRKQQLRARAVTRCRSAIEFPDTTSDARALVAWQVDGEGWRALASTF
ncbi:MAG: hypothetical protein ACI89X_003279 [Planctomycetota bacterium]|jgi:hypothetical protein